ncbi:MAG: hypothetical protein P4L22_00650 [Candidatus Babeliales bacterium]|nr:hypothetical protein [Candidatus Babeliales bacterium]
MFKKLFLILPIVFLVYSAEEKLEIQLTPDLLNKIIKSVELSKENTKSFHHYQISQENIFDRKHEIIIKLSVELWLVIPKSFGDLNIYKEFHGGYLIYQGKNYGWKSFFPISWNKQRISNYISDSFKIKQQEIKNQTKSTTKYRLRLTGNPIICITEITHLKNNNNLNVDFFYPQVESQECELSEIIKEQKAEYLEHEKPKEYKLLSIKEKKLVQQIENLEPNECELPDLAIEKHDIIKQIEKLKPEDDTSKIIEFLENPVEQLLGSEMLLASINIPQVQLVELLLCGTGITPNIEHLKLALKINFQKFPKDQLEIVKLILQYIKQIDKEVFQTILSTNNKKFIELLIHRCLTNKFDLDKRTQEYLNEKFNSLYDLCKEQYKLNK